MSSSHSIQDERTAKERFLLAAGLGYVLLIVALIFLPLHAELPEGGSAAQLASAYANERSGFVTEQVIGGVSIVCFLIFASALSGVLRRAEDESGALSRLVFGSGIAFVVLALVQPIFEAAAANLAGQGGNPEVVDGLKQLASVTSSFAFFPMALFLVTASVAMLVSRIVPRWVGWLGLASALLFFAGVGIVYDPAGPLGLVAFIGALLQLVWVLATSIVLLRRPRSRAHQAGSRVETPA